MEFISAFDNKESGRKRLEKLTSSKTQNNRKYRGINFFNKDDLSLLLTIARGEFNINGFRNKHLRKLLALKGTKISRLLKRLHVHGLIKKAADSYKYYLTRMGKETIIMAQKIKEAVLVPAYSY
jgi:predicted transcriptional regulator